MDDVRMDAAEQALTVRNENRKKIDLLFSRVDFLCGKDRVLMTMYLKNGNSFRQMACLTGVNEVNVARKIHKLTKRLLDSHYIVCLRNRDMFTSHEMDIAKDYFVQGKSLRKIAAERKISYQRLWKTVNRIKKLVALIGRNTTQSLNQQNFFTESGDNRCHAVGG